MTPRPNPHWHTLTIDETFSAIDTKPDGLDPVQVNARLAHYGQNLLPEIGRHSRLLIILRQLNNPLTLILFVAALVSFFLGQTTDAIFICAVVVIDMTIGTVQEWNAEASAASLKKAMHISPTVIRRGQRCEVDISQIVPGDIVCLESGVVVPADMRMTSVHDLEIDESLLTGESQPVEKNPVVECEVEAPLGDRANMAFAGTMVTTGRGTGIICETASNTQLGHIARALVGKGGRAPLIMRLEKFSNRIAVMTVILALLIGAGQYFRGETIYDVFILTTALAVSAIPEGLPMAITVALSVASSRMGKRNVIVRSLPAVEALGSCTLIAADKTGTLTANRLTAKKVILANGDEIDVEGEGLELDGGFHLAEDGDLSKETQTHLQQLAMAGALTNEAELVFHDENIETRGDAVDIAFLILAKKLGLESKVLRQEYQSCQSIPYEPENGFSASLNSHDASEQLVVKGAPEVILRMCIENEENANRERLHQLTSNGYRVIALARKVRNGEGARSELVNLHLADLNKLEFLGFVGLIDPLRSEAPQAVNEACAAGVDVRMITGDHPETALAISRQLGPLWLPDTALTGAELKNLEGSMRTSAITNTQIFARVEPTQKNLIVSELQEQGHFVAVTGDGVNDAPALKAAHVGIAMGAGGTDVARAASDLIITDDNFASIIAGIEEGRAAYDNIRKIIWLLISTAITEVVAFAIALLFGFPVPLTAVQILWLNLVTEGIQDVALAFEGKEPDTMRRHPRNPQEPIFDRQMIEQCLLVGFYIGVLAFVIFYYLYEMIGLSVEQTRNIVLLFLVSFNNFHTLNCRSETRSAFAIPLRANPFLIWSIIGAQALHIIAMHIPVTQNLLAINPVSLQEWATAMSLAGTVFLWGEFYKLAVSRPRARRNISKAPHSHSQPLKPFASNP